MPSGFYGYTSVPKKYRELKRQRVLNAFELLLKRMIEYSKTKESLSDENENLDFIVRVQETLEKQGLAIAEDSPEAQLERFRTDNIKRSGFRIRRLSEIIELRNEFRDTVPEQVSDETLDRTEKIFQDLVTANALELHPTNRLPEKAMKNLLEDISTYAGAVFSIGNPGQLSPDTVYPFDDYLTLARDKA